MSSYHHLWVFCSKVLISQTFASQYMQRNFLHFSHFHRIWNSQDCISQRNDTLIIHPCTCGLLLINLCNGASTSDFTIQNKRQDLDESPHSTHVPLSPHLSDFPGPGWTAARIPFSSIPSLRCFLGDITHLFHEVSCHVIKSSTS